MLKRVLSSTQEDTIISGLASDKIRAKIVKEGITHKVKFRNNQVRNYGDSKAGSQSTQQHLDRMQDLLATAKVNYVRKEERDSMENLIAQRRKSKKGKKLLPHSLDATVMKALLMESATGANRKDIPAME